MTSFLVKLGKEAAENLDYLYRRKKLSTEVETKASILATKKRTWQAEVGNSKAEVIKMDVCLLGRSIISHVWL